MTNRKFNTINYDRSTKDFHRQIVLDYLSLNPCVHCGESDIRCLEFNHLGNKKGNISDMIGKVELNTLLKEISKCEVLCSNCHRKYTCKQCNNYKQKYIDNLKDNNYNRNIDKEVNLMIDDFIEAIEEFYGDVKFHGIYNGYSGHKGVAIRADNESILIQLGASMADFDSLDELVCERPVINTLGRGVIISWPVRLWNRSDLDRIQSGEFQSDDY